MREITETTGKGPPVWFYPGANRQGAVNAGSAQQLQITPANGEPWIGVFSAGYDGGLTKLMSCPNPHWLCVISAGAAYFVDSRDPQDWHEAEAFPVMHALAAPDAGLLLLGDFTDFMAWGREGRRWRSGRLSLDGLQNLRVAGMQLRGEGWYPQVWEEFTLDLATGEHEGGLDLASW